MEHKWTVQAAVMGLAAMTIMANATIAASLPGLAAHFDGVAGIGTLAPLMLTLPSIAIVLTAGMVGWAADRWNRQVLLAVVAVLYALGGAAGLWADSFWAILAGRLVLGVGVAGTMTLAFTWGGDLFQGPARAVFLGRQGAAIAGGGIVFMLAGGLLSGVSWRGAFAVYALVLPVAGYALWVLAPLARQRTRTAAAVTPFPVPDFALVGGLCFLFMAGFYLIPTRLPFVLQDLGVRSAAVAGAIMSVTTLISLPFSLAFGWLRARFSAMALFAFSFAMLAVGLGLIGAANSAWAVIPEVAVIGSGLGLMMPNAMTFLMARVAPDWRGRASGLLTTAFFIGQFASPLLSAPLVAALGRQGAFGAEAVVVLAIAAGVLLSQTRRQLA